jgi:predicted GH43/DUF377 family glycosyl hydrolase
MKNKQEIEKLIATARRRVNSLNTNDLNKIIDSNERKATNRNTRFSNARVNNGENNDIKRPETKFLSKLNGKFKTLLLPEEGAFNAGIARLNEQKIVCIYRCDEYNFIACHLDNNYNVISDSFFKLNTTGCVDPKLIWRNNELVVIYSSVNGNNYEREYMCGCILIDKNISDNFIHGHQFRISPKELDVRQKNWMPFIYDDKIYLVASVCPHIIYELVDNYTCLKAFETPWNHCWFTDKQLRGNTNIIKLNDGNYLGTFHTVISSNNKQHYDNGFYVFEGKPPFKVIKCANRTYLPAEAACQKYYRNENHIVCIFPVGMILENGKIIISYGENDSVVKIVEFKLEDVLNTMVYV